MGSYSPPDNQMDFACWIHALSIGSTGEVALKMMAELDEEYQSLHWLKGWRRRREIDRETDFLMRLYQIATEYAKTQEP